MNQHYNNCDQGMNECYTDNNCECDKYKQKSDELYIKAHYVKDESARLICEANDLDDQARELEKMARELCAKSSIAWDQARRLESESKNLLDLASFYCQKASECYKNMNNNNNVSRPTCNSWSNQCSCKNC